MAEPTWKDAIVKVLKAAGEPMGYVDITEKILADGIKTTVVGLTPERTVSQTLTTNRDLFVKTARGVYYLWQERDPIKPDRTATPEDDLDATDETGSIAVAAYGLHWERARVDWSANRLLGYDVSLTPDDSIDFADQQGVYLLHDLHSVVYVGRTSAKVGGLLTRLKSHHNRREWAGKWKWFSWFGIREVKEDGTMVDGPNSASKDVVTALMEAVLIEILGPSLNKNQGTYMGSLYHQATDPKIAQSEAKKLLQAASAS